MRRPTRWVGAAAIAALASETWLHRSAYRGWEATSAAWLSHIVTGSRTFASRPHQTMFAGVGTAKAFGLVITTDCSSAVTTAVLLAVTALLCLASRMGFLRLGLAVLASSATFAVANLLRVVGIVVATRTWGMGPGFRWSHMWAGTFVTVFGAAVTGVVYLYALGIHRHDLSSASP